MHLLNAKTYQLEEYVGDDIPPYAILSHTWGPEEVFLPTRKIPHRPRRNEGFGRFNSLVSRP